MIGRMETLRESRLWMMALIPTAILLSMGILAMIGLEQAGDDEVSVNRQIIYIAGSLVFMFGVIAVPYQRIGRHSYVIYAILLVMLLLLAIVPRVASHVGMSAAVNKIMPEINGSNRWIRLPGIQIQPSEFMKLSFVLALGWYLRYRKNYRRFKGLIGPFVVTMLPMALIVVQPDLGTVLLFVPVLFIMLFCAGAKVKHLLGVVALVAVCSPFFFTFLLHDYQRSRLAGMAFQSDIVKQWLDEHRALRTYLYHENRDWAYWDRRGDGYQLTHSKQSLGSGGLRGYGHGNGPYVELWWQLPEDHNDFVFAMIGHQFGFVGCAIVLASYGVLVLVGIEAAAATQEPYGRLVVIGAMSMLVVQALINVAMTVGLAPITGITLPLVSYGGSSMVTSLLAVGLLVNVSLRRPRLIAHKPFELATLEDDE